MDGEEIGKGWAERLPEEQDDLLQQLEGIFEEL
jgi:hypothetical protein